MAHSEMIPRIPYTMRYTLTHIKLAALLVLLPFLLLTSCQEQPKDLISEETYIDLLVEFELLNNLHETTEDTDSVLRKISMVYEHYNTTEEQFIRSHAHYQQDVQKQVQRHRTAVERLSQVQNEISNRRSPPKEKKDSD